MRVVADTNHILLMDLTEIRINIRLNISISHQVRHHHVERTIPNHYDLYMSQCLRI